MSKRLPDKEDSPRSCRPRAAGEFVGDTGDQSFPRIGLVQHSIVRRWGEKALVSLSLGLTASRMYPTLKYALGHGKACSKVTVGGVTTPVAHLAMAA